MFWHIVCGAVVGAVVNTAISLGSSLLSGEKITPSQVVSSLVGGAITGGVTVATGIPTVGSLVGGSVETVVKGKMERKSNAEIVQDVAVGAVVDVAFINMGKYITNTSQIKQVTDCVKKTKIGNRIFAAKEYFDTSMKKGREAFKAGKNIWQDKRTYLCGLVGTGGIDLLDKVNDMQASYMPGVDIKGELKNMLNDLYDKGEEANEMREYTRQALDRLLKNVTNKEMKSVLCIQE